MFNVLNKLIVSSVVLSSTLLGIAPAFAGQWEEIRAQATFNFGYHLSNQFIHKVNIKSGELTTNYAQTEAEIVYNTGSCSSDSYLEVDFKLELVEDGYSYFDSTSVTPQEGKTAATAIIQFDDIEIDPDTVHLTVSSSCNLF